MSATAPKVPSQPVPEAKCSYEALNRDHVHVDVSAVQFLGLGDHHAVFDLRFGSECTEALNVLVHRPAADIASYPHAPFLQIG